MSSATTYVYVGTYTQALPHVDGKAEGIYVYTLEPTSGALLLAANQNSDSIVAFRIDPVNGALTPTGAVTEVPTPVCIAFCASS